MSHLLEDLICGAIGYGIGKNISNKDVKNIIDSYLKNVTIDDLMHDYSQFHNIDSSTGFQTETLEDKCQYGMGGSFF